MIKSSSSPPQQKDVEPISALRIAAGQNQDMNVSLGGIVTLCRTIIRLASIAKENKKSCRRLCNRVTALQWVIQSIQSQRCVAPGVTAALENLHRTLSEAKKLLRECKDKTKKFKILSHRRKLNEISESLTIDFELLSGVLHVDQRCNAVVPVTPDEDEDEDDEDEGGPVGPALVVYYEELILHSSAAGSHSTDQTPMISTPGFQSAHPDGCFPSSRWDFSV
ncbi:uncharacterized protein LOC128771382 [Synchiropus splendidus]|uniref:uncharacterized protein LOC128771382 n=1 Tax=Synchiropus splendidus TaxID=270530 RepID=UPI00237D60E0|nr:uncharacterized protein LOC128771382 [Synchiropus splendidus]